MNASSNIINKGRFNLSINGGQAVGFNEFSKLMKVLKDLGFSWRERGIFRLEIVREKGKTVTGHEIIRGFDTSGNMISSEIFNNGSVLLEVVHAG